MPLIQRNSPTFSNLVYTTGNYSNPVWINSLSPYKVGNHIAQWNASKLSSFPIDTGNIRSGEYLYFTGSGWQTFPAQGGTGIISGSGGLVNIGSYFGGKSIDIPHPTYTGTSGNRFLSRTKINEANSFRLSDSGIFGLCEYKSSSDVNISIICERGMDEILVSEALFKNSIDPLVDFNAEITIHENNFEFLPGDILGFYFNSCDSDLAGIYLSAWGNSLYGGGSGGSGGSGIYFTAQDGVVLSGSILSMSGVGSLTRLNFQQNPNYYIHSGILITDSLDGFVNLENTFVGTDTQNSLENFYNVALGRYCMSYASGDRNIAIGSNSLSFVGSEDSIAIGTEALSNTLNISYSNIGIGSYSLNSSNSIGNIVAVGESAFNSTSSAGHSIGIGYFAGSLSRNIYNSIFIGEGAGSYSVGSGNTYFGYNAGQYSSGNNNIEILSGMDNSKIADRSNKINIGNLIYGDLAGKKLAIGNVSSSNFNPSGFVEVVASGSPALFVSSHSGYIYDFLSCKAGSVVFKIDCSGNVSGNNANFNIISGAISPSIVQSTGLLLTDFYHGKIIEHTGISLGVYTIGSVTIPSWQCTLVNYGGGISVASGSNIIRSKSNFTNISTLHSYGSIYRRPNGEFFLYGELN